MENLLHGLGDLGDVRDAVGERENAQMWVYPARCGRLDRSDGMSNPIVNYSILFSIL